MLTPVFSAELNIDMDNLKEFEKDTDVAVSDVNFTIPKGFYDLGYVDFK